MKYAVELGGGHFEEMDRIKGGRADTESERDATVVITLGEEAIVRLRYHSSLPIPSTLYYYP